MELLDEAHAPAPEAPFEDVECAPLGGTLRVRALDLPQRLAFEARIKALAAKNPDAGDAAVYPVLPELLALCVVGKKGTPYYTVERWRLFSSNAANQGLVLQLFNKAWSLSGLGGEDAKKN